VTHEPRLYIPRIMADMMVATTANSTSIHFGFGHMCEEHKCLFDLKHIKECSLLTGCGKVPEYAAKLKETPFTEWDLKTKGEAIGAFALLIAELHNLTVTHRAKLVNTRPVREYVKTGRRRGRPTNIQRTAETNTSLYQFFKREDISQ